MFVAVRMDFGLRRDQISLNPASSLSYLEAEGSVLD